MFTLQKKEDKNSPKLWVLSENEDYITSIFSKEKADWLKIHLFNHKKDFAVLTQAGAPTEIFIRPEKETNEISKQLENCRNLASKALSILENEESDNVDILGNSSKNHLLATAEGLSLSAYRFVKYFSDPEKKQCKLQKINIISSEISKSELDELAVVLNAVKQTRNWVNEPASYLTATQLAEEMADLAKKSGAKVEILTKKKIEALKMGGLLAVNQGSKEPPTFTVIEWNPEKPINNQPVVLVGKGITFDTGGSNLKPDHYMDDMKQDMAGAATMAATICAVAQNKLPIHVVALMPSTDNRLSNNSFLPSDIITMHNGKTVEVGNTDAEGRLILADAISYAGKFNPLLIIDMATLTGGASRAIGKHGMVAMGNARNYLDALIMCSFEVYERIAEFPFWDDYADELKSNIADLSNMGKAEGGTISAGKFLEKFTDFPFIHLDIAGCAYLSKADGWKTAGGTGTGVRLLYHFLKKMSKK